MVEIKEALSKLPVICKIEIIPELLSLLSYEEYFVFLYFKSSIKNGFFYYTTLYQISNFLKIKVNKIENAITKMLNLNLIVIDNINKSIEINDEKLNYYRNLGNKSIEIFNEQINNKVIQDDYYMRSRKILLTEEDLNFAKINNFSIESAEQILKSKINTKLINIIHPASQIYPYLKFPIISKLLKELSPQQYLIYAVFFDIIQKLNIEQNYEGIALNLSSKKNFVEDTMTKLKSMEIISGEYNVKDRTSNLEISEKEIAILINEYLIPEKREQERISKLEPKIKNYKVQDKIMLDFPKSRPSID